MCCFIIIQQFLNIIFSQVTVPFEFPHLDFKQMWKFQIGLMVCEKGNIMFQELLDDYKTAHFIFTDGSFDLTTNVTRITNTCLCMGLLQTIKSRPLTLLFFFLKIIYAKNHLTGKLEVTENTIAVHHFIWSWLPKEEIIAGRWLKKSIKFFRLVQERWFPLCGFIAYTKFYGIMGSVKKCTTWITNRIWYIIFW